MMEMIAAKNMSLGYARRLLRFFAEKKEALSPLLILTHDYPDPDALASAYALHFLAEKGFGIEARIVYEGVIRRMENRAMVRLLKIPAHKLRHGDLKRYASIALVDTQPAFKNNPFPEAKRAAIVIDQHPSVGKVNADIALIDPACGATSVILSQALLALKMEIPTKVATALSYGILTDTLNMYRAEEPHVSKTYLDILSRSDLKVLAQIQNPVRSRRYFVTLNRGIQNAMMRRGLMVSHLGFIDSPDSIAHVADFLLTYKGVKWSLVTGRFKSRLYVSFRTAKSTVEAGEILREVFTHRRDAGGHDTVAGGSFRVSQGTEELVWNEAESGLVERLVRRLRIPVKSEFYFPFRKS